MYSLLPLGTREEQYQETNGMDVRFVRMRHKAIPIHRQALPPLWEEYQKRYMTYEHFDSCYRYHQVEESWQRRAWYSERERNAEILESLGLKILNQAP